MECNFRIGHGYDVHALAEGLPLIIGGVRIEYHRGCVAHSDGDVLSHAISDAILGALSMGDIGYHFPDTDKRYEGADSIVLLQEVNQLAAKKNYRIVNLDSTILLQEPKLRGHIDRIRQNLASALSVDIGCVSVKATTEERLGFTGTGQGIAAHAVVLLSESTQ